MKNFVKKPLFIAAVGFLLLLGTTATQAGFQWVPPAGAPQQQGTAAPAQDSMDTSSPAPLLPEEEQAAPASPKPAPVITRRNIVPIEEPPAPDASGTHVLKLRTVTPPARTAAPQAPSQEDMLFVPPRAAAAPVADTMTPIDLVPEPVTATPAPAPVAEPVIITVPPSPAAIPAATATYASPAATAGVIIQDEPQHSSSYQAPRRSSDWYLVRLLRGEEGISWGRKRQPDSGTPEFQAEQPSYDTAPMVITPPSAPPPPIAVQEDIFQPPAPVMEETPAPARLYVSPTPVQDAGFAKVEGFGSDIPLALALREVVPPEYAYSLDAGVNPASLVTWEGGRSWNVVVSAMIQPLNLEAVLNGRTLHIRPVGGFAAPQKHSALNNMPAEETSPAPSLRRTAIQDPGEEPAMKTAEAAMTVPAPEIAETIEPAAGTEKTPVPAQEQAQEQTETIVTAEQPVIDMTGPSPMTVVSVQQTEKNISFVSSGALEAMQAKAAEEEDATEESPAVAAVTESSAPEEPAVVDTAQEETPAALWEAKIGDSLKDTLARWSEKAGIEMIWMASYDYKVRSDMLVNDSFQNAVRTMFTNGIDSPGGTPSLQLIQGRMVIKDPAPAARS